MPAPPQRVQTGAPRKPSSPIRAKTSRCASCFSSHSRICGAISVWAKSRTVRATSSFSGVSDRSIAMCCDCAGEEAPRVTDRDATDQPQASDLTALVASVLLREFGIDAATVDYQHGGQDDGATVFRI